MTSGGKSSGRASRLVARLVWAALRVFTAMCWFLVLQVSILGEGAGPYLGVTLTATVLCVAIFMIRRSRAAGRKQKARQPATGTALLLLPTLLISACKRGDDDGNKWEKIFVPAEFELPASYSGDPRQGVRIYFDMDKQACIVCHPLNGRGWPNAPDLGRLGTRSTEDGVTNETFREFVIQSLMDPDAVLAEEFPAGVMPSYKGVMQDQEVEDLVAFLWLQRGGGS